MTTTSKPLFLEDLPPGTTFKSRPYEMTVPEIKDFARQFDPQPFHMDEASAEKSFFNGLAASGWHTAALTMRLMVESIPISGGLIGAGLEDLRWFIPVRPGDTLHVESEVISVRRSQSKPQQGFVRVRHITYNQHGDKVQQFISTMVVPAMESPEP